MKLSGYLEFKEVVVDNIETPVTTHTPHSNTSYNPYPTTSEKKMKLKSKTSRTKGDGVSYKEKYETERGFVMKGGSLR